MSQTFLELVIKSAKQGQGGKQAAAELKELKGTVSEVSSGLLGFDLAGVSTIGTVVALGSFVKESVSEWSEYTERVGKAADAAGINAEEMSRLMQAADDARVDIEALETAMVRAQQNGFQPSIENLANLADELQAMASPTDRAEKLSKLFGRNWAEIYPLLKDGGDAIRENTAAIEDNMIATDKAVRQNRDYIAAVDELQDTWQGTKNEIGRSVIPALTWILDITNKSNTALRENKSIWDNILAALPGIGAFYRLIMAGQLSQEEAAREVGKALLEYNTMMDIGAGITQNEVIPAVGQFTRELSDLRDMLSGNFGEEQVKFAEKQRDIRNAIAETKAKIDELEQKPYLTVEQKENLTALHGDLITLQNEFQTTAQAHEEAMHKMAYNMLLERAASDGMTENELKNLTQLGVQWGLLDLKTAEVVTAINNNMNLLDTDNPGQLYTILNNIMGLPGGKTFKFDVQVDGLNDLERMNALMGEPGPVGQPDVPPPTTGGDEIIDGKRANAGHFVVPSGFPNDSYTVGLSTGEEVWVVNNRMRWTNSQPGAPVGGMTLNINLGGVVINSEMDYRTFVARLEGDIGRGVLGLRRKF